MRQDEPWIPPPIITNLCSLTVTPVRIRKTGTFELGLCSLHLREGIDEGSHVLLSPDSCASIGKHRDASASLPHSFLAKDQLLSPIANADAGSAVGQVVDPADVPNSSGCCPPHTSRVDAAHSACLSPLACNAVVGWARKLWAQYPFQLSSSLRSAHSFSASKGWEVRYVNVIPYSSVSGVCSPCNSLSHPLRMLLCRSRKDPCPNPPAGLSLKALTTLLPG